MKVLKIFLLLFGLFLTNSNYSFAQEMKMEEPKEEKKPEIKEEKMDEMRDVKEEVPEHLKFYKEKYEIKVPAGGTKTTEEIFDVIVKIVEDGKCQVGTKTIKPDEKNNGLLKGKVESDFCVFVDGKDLAFDTLQVYSYKLPVIRGGIWENGRIQYKVYLKEYDDGAVDLLIKAEISGMESFVTNDIHFWKSNGIFETRLVEKIKTKLGIK